MTQWWRGSHNLTRASVSAEGDPDGPQTTRVRVVPFATAAVVLSAAPIFLVGAQAVQIGATLGLDPATLGITGSIFFGTTALSTATLGRLVQRHGPRRSMTWATLLNIAAVIGVSVSRSVEELGAALIVGGLANGAMHPSANALLALRGRVERLGLGLGIKQSAPTMASLVGGFAVPALALTVGWRWSFVVFALLGALFVMFLRGLEASPAPTPTPMMPQRGPRLVTTMPVRWLAVIAALGACAGNSLNLFAVDYGVHVVGLSPAAAGESYAVASLAGLLGRLLGGRWMDRSDSPGPLPVTLVLLVVAVGSDLLMFAGGSVGFIAGLVAAYGFGWAWPTLLHYSAVSGNIANAATATGTLMTGFAAGSFSGPLFLGQIATHIGYSHLWLVASGFNVLAAGLLAARLLRLRGQGLGARQE